MLTRSKTTIDQCSICYQSDFEEIGCLNCHHVFCIGCIREWIYKSGKCPICRRVTTSVQTVILKKRSLRFRVDHSFIQVKRPIEPIEPIEAIVPLDYRRPPPMRQRQPERQRVRSRLGAEMVRQVRQVRQSIPVPTQVVPVPPEPVFERSNQEPTLFDIMSFHLPTFMVENRVLQHPQSRNMLQTESFADSQPYLYELDNMYSVVNFHEDQDSFPISQFE